MAKKVGAGEWSKLEHVQGKATDLPQMLEDLQSPKEARRSYALQEARDALFSESEWFSAQPKFVGALFDLADKPKVPERHKLLHLAVAILTQGIADKVTTGLDLRKPELKKRYAEEIPTKILAVFLERVPFLVGLLADKDPALRAAAAKSLAFLFDASPKAVGPLVDAIGRERDEAVLGTMLQCLALLLRYSDGGEHRAVLEAHRAPARPLLVRTCTSTGLLALDGARAYTPDVFALFLDAMDLPEPPVDRFPLTNGRPSSLIYESVLTAAASAEVHRLRFATLERGTAPQDVWNRLANAMFKSDFRQARYATRTDFTPEQLTKLELMSRRDTQASFHYVGVPVDRRMRRRWLELDEPGPMNMPIEVKVGKGQKQAVPLWKALLDAEEDPDARPAILRKHCSPMQILAFLEDYMFLEEAEDDSEFTEVDCGADVYVEAIDRAGVDALPWAKAITERLLGRLSLRSALDNVTLLPLARALAKGAVLDERFDAAVCPCPAREPKSIKAAREVLSAIPPERREAIFLGYTHLVATPERAFRPTLDLCPTPKFMKYLLEALDGRHNPDGPAGIMEDDAEETLEAIVKVAQKHPDVAATLKKFVPKGKFMKAALKKALKGSKA